MSKVAVSLAFLVIGGGTCVTGAYFLGAFGDRTALPEELEGDNGFKKWDGGKCVKGLFNGLGKMDKNALEEVKDNAVSSSFLEAESKGCLVVNWNKETKQGDTDQKWRGTFRFLWAVKSKNKGFILFTVGKAKDESGTKKISWDGIAYQVERTNDKSPWELKGKKEEQNNKSFSASTSDEGQFPKPGDVLGQVKDYPFWGFFTSKDTDIAKICADSDCSATTPMDKTSFKGYWEWEGKSDGQKDLSGWTKDLEKWWKEIYGEDKWKMNDVVKDKKGTWTKKHLSTLPPKPTTGGGGGN